jgi:hypothetical protein
VGYQAHRPRKAALHCRQAAQGPLNQPFNKAIAMTKQVAPEDVRSKLKDIVRSATKNRLNSCTRSHFKIELSEVSNPDDFVYGYWMSFILLSGKDLQITVKCHFFSDEAGHLAAVALKRQLEQISQPNIQDFMREYCNLVAGEIKASLWGSKVTIGLSLPLITRGFDEVIFSDQTDSRQFSDWWRLSWGSGSMIMSFVAEVYQPSALVDLKVPARGWDSNGDIDFL